MNNSFVFIIFMISFVKSVFCETIEININTIVLERSCTISRNTTDLNVKLETSDLKGKQIGIPFSETPLSIILENCPSNIDYANITFKGESDKIVKSLLKNNDTTSSGAQGVAIGLYDHDKKNIDISDNRLSLNINHNEPYNSFDLYSYYVITNVNPSAGKITSTINFEISYD